MTSFTSLHRAIGLAFLVVGPALLGAGCGNAPQDMATVDMAVECTASETRCGSACIRTATDPQNCGACGTVCPRSNFCVDGKCMTDCPKGQSACGDHCATLETDRENCGS